MRIPWLRASLLVFALAESLLALLNVIGYHFPRPPLGLDILGFFSVHSLPISVLAWGLVGLTFLRSRQLTSMRVFASRGFDEEVYDLMVSMRGSTSRLALLRGMDVPRHRNDLAQITGINWKEVDRQLGILEKCGVARVYASSGTIKMYQLTEQGRLLVQLMDELKQTSS